jgi:hypothetical protein
MLPPHWFGAEDARAAYARTLDAVNGLDAWTSAKQFETSLLSANARTLLEQQRTLEDFASQHRASAIDLGADAALARLTLASVSADLLSNARLHAAELHWHLAEATGAVDYASKWADIQRAISGAGAGLPPWDDVRRMTDALGLENALERHLARIREFDMVLRGMLAEPAHLAWATHLRMTALPTVSFLGQEWRKPVGLLTDLGAELGASVAWLTRQRAEPLLMTAAITPEAKSRDGLKIVIEDEILCRLCENPLITTGSRLKWVGPRRAVRQRFVLPLCATCLATEHERPGFFRSALGEGTGPAVGIRGVIRGGGRGDREIRGVLRLVRIEGRDDKA